MITLCPSCGAELRVGDWPYCPHGRKGSFYSAPDTYGTNQTYENYGSTEVTFRSESERRRYMAEHGLLQKEKWCPTPGTDKDPSGRQNPARYIDEQTLENVKALLSRVQPRSEDAVDVGAIIKNQFVLVDGGRDAKAAFVEGDKRRLSRVGRRTRGRDQAVDTHRNDDTQS